MEKRNMVTAGVLVLCLVLASVAALLLELPADISKDTSLARLVITVLEAGIFLSYMNI